MSRLFARIAAGRKSKPKPKPKAVPAPDPAPRSSPAPTPVPTRRSSRLPRRTSSAQAAPALPSWLQAHFDQAVQAEARKRDPRPSRVFAAVDALFRHRIPREEKDGFIIHPGAPAGRLCRTHPNAGPWLQAHRGTVLAAARARLPRQPDTPMSRAPYERDLGHPVNPGVSGVIDRGSSVLVGRPIAAEGFTGGGLFSIALLAEGVYTPDVCELDPNAVQTLRLNLHEHATATNAFDWEPALQPGGLDILCGGPPCQEFSSARTMGTPGLGVESGRNMYPRILDWVADTQPRVVLMENSAEVATTRSRSIRGTETIQAPGETRGATRRFFEAWWRNLDAIGYEGIYWVLYAPDYGTPQHRVRAWVVAWPKGAPWGAGLRQAPAPTHGHPTSRSVRDGQRLPWVSTFDRLMGGCCGGYGLAACIHLGNDQGACWTCEDGQNFYPAPNQEGEQGRRGLSTASKRTYAGMAGPNRTRLKMLPPIDLSSFSAFRERLPIEKVTAGMKVTEWLSKAVVAHFGKDEKSAAIVREDIPAEVYKLRDSPKERDRRRFVDWIERLSCREAAKLQDVPQWWAFTWDPADARSEAAQRRAVFRQIGNGIPVNMGRAAVRQVLGALGYNTPIPGSMASDETSGLWPTDRVDPCALFNAPYAVRGAMWDTENYEREYAARKGREPRLPTKPSLTREERTQRPIVDQQALTQYRRERDFQQARRPYWHDPNGDGVEVYNWAAIARDTFLAGEIPPGMEGSWELGRELEGVSGYAADHGWISGKSDASAVVNHLIHAYAKGEAGDPRDIRAGERALAEALTEGAALGDYPANYRYDESMGLPRWSPYR